MNGWIDINETKPESGQIVDIWVVEEEFQGAYRIADAEFDGEIMIFTDPNGDDYDLMDEEAEKKVTHWMPLPEPPEVQP